MSDIIKSNLILLTFDPHRDLKRWMQHVKLDGEPTECMCLARKRQCEGDAAYVIPLNNAHKFYPETRQEVEDAFRTAQSIAKILECPDHPETWPRLLLFIQDGLSELLAMKPAQQQRKVVGEGKLIVDGEARTFEVTEH